MWSNWDVSEALRKLKSKSSPLSPLIFRLFISLKCFKSPNHPSLNNVMKLGGVWKSWKVNPLLRPRSSLTSFFLHTSHLFFFFFLLKDRNLCVASFHKCFPRWFHRLPPKLIYYQSFIEGQRQPPFSQQFHNFLFFFLTKINAITLFDFHCEIFSSLLLNCLFWYFCRFSCLVTHHTESSWQGTFDFFEIFLRSLSMKIPYLSSWGYIIYLVNIT